MNPNIDSDFYKKIPLKERFVNILNPENYRTLPDNWFVAVTDVVQSTKAVAEGRYKDVNILGASSIVAMLNMAGQDALPFSFSGDGAVVCVPPEFEGETRNILYRCMEIGSKQYELELRASLIPVSFIRERGYEIKVTRYRVSDHYNQALFTGGGIRYAEALLKDPEGEQFGIDTPVHEQPVDFSGLECRWKKVEIDQKEVITLLVMANPGREGGERVYEEVLDRMRDLFGFEEAANPVDPGGLDMYFSIPALMSEAKIHTFGMNLFQQLKYLFKMEFQVLLGKIFMWFGHRSSATDWALYKWDLSLNSDFRKFDDMFRTVVSGTADKRKQLELFLEQKFENRELVYGMHITDSVMVTCMVFKYHCDHIHFVDGSGGGYVEASKDLKRRMKMQQ